MTDPVRDPVVRRAIDELRRLPEVDAAAMRRVVEAAAAARLSPSDDETPLLAAPARSSWLLRTSLIAAAAALVGFFASSAWRPHAAVDNTAANGQAAALSLRPAANGENELVPVAQQFVFSRRGAHKVSVVGDFNRWNSSAAPMTRSPDGELWSVTIPVLPGRHSYGFMVDDSIFVLDSAAARARDADLGSESSVIIVGKP